MKGFGFLLDFVFPSRCLACREFLKNSSAPLCTSCEGLWPSLKVPYSLSPKFKCRKIHAAGLYSGILLEMIVRMKYHQQEKVASYLGTRMAETLLKTEPYDLILPIPLHPSRLRERGYNQAWLMASEIGRALTTEVNPFLLFKKRPTALQTKLTGEERRRNLKKAFEVKDRQKVQGLRVLLVDDVYTTGTTIEEAAKVLVASGAELVEAVVAARTE